jgi:hypothetical protein
MTALAEQQKARIVELARIVEHDLRMIWAHENAPKTHRDYHALSNRMKMAATASAEAFHIAKDILRECAGGVRG